MIKRIVLFLLTNILIVATLSFITNMLGLYGYLNQYGLEYQALALFCLVWGMGSSILSLLMSRWMARLFMRVKLIDPDSNMTDSERALLRKVYHLARKAGLDTMPQVGVYRASEFNAFATGPSKNRALVAVSSGLWQSMSEDEVDGVLGHEISHIVNGDMVTMTLLQGTVNAFSMFLSHVLAYMLSTALHRSSDRNHHHRNARTTYYVLRIVLDIVITLLGALIVAAFSRYREYRADKGGAALAGRAKMVAALERLRLVTTMPHEETQDSFVASLQIARRQSRMLELFATHPDINLRIEALKR